MSARYLRRDGLLVRPVTTPEEALAELTGGPDAVAVLDLTMPGLDPRRIRRALRTPVIFLVAGPQGPRPRGLARAGATGPRRWLARPFGPRQLIAMVRDVLAAPVPQPAGDAGDLGNSGGMVGFADDQLFFASHATGSGIPVMFDNFLHAGRIENRIGIRKYNISCTHLFHCPVHCRNLAPS